MNVITDHDIGKAYYINRSSSLLLAYKNVSVMMRVRRVRTSRPYANMVDMIYIIVVIGDGFFEREGLKGCSVGQTVL